MNAEWIDDDDALDDVVDEILGEARDALDPEFHRERTYYPQLALVQLRWRDRTALVDPLAVDPRGLRPLFDGAPLAVFHAAQQDLDVLWSSAGAIPERIFDTQIAAGFLGYSTPSLQTLAQSLLRVSLPKGDRLTDWLRRPLTRDQREYAARDVEHLLEMHRRLTEDLERLGRTEWVAASVAELVRRSSQEHDPDAAWLRLKDVRTLKGESRGVAQALAAWRELRAADDDVPVRRVMSDMALVGIAQRMPATTEDLAHVRGVDDRLLRGATAREIIDAVRRGRGRTPARPERRDEDLDARARAALTLMGSWVAEVARRERLDPVLLATRADLVDFANGGSTGRLAEGWRAALVARDLRDILEGRAGVAVDDRGRLRLVDCPPMSSR
ncbi:MAG: ribonuclease D [Ilumatobacteraceae bacterium]